MALKCLAQDCMHNNGGSCFAKTINIRGREAKAVDQTQCESFIQGDLSRINYRYEISKEFIDQDAPSDVAGITCEALNCKHNKNQNCRASKVMINLEKASCETFSV